MVLPYSDDPGSLEWWRGHVVGTGIAAMLEATMSDPAIQPPRGHRLDLDTQFQAVLNRTKLTSEFLNLLEWEMGLSPEHICELLITDLTEGLREAPDGTDDRKQHEAASGYSLPGRVGRSGARSQAPTTHRKNPFRSTLRWVLTDKTTLHALPPRLRAHLLCVLTTFLDKLEGSGERWYN